VSITFLLTAISTCIYWETLINYYKFFFISTVSFLFAPKIITMKKTTLFTLIAIIAFSAKSFAQSENYTPFQANFTGGYALASGKGTKGGIALHFEPQYNITDNISVGLRFGAALTAKFRLDASGQEIGESDIAAVGSYLATGSYYFQKEPGASFRPFAGIGVGYASAAGISTVDLTDPNANFGEEAVSKSGLGALVRAGFDISHFRFNLEYNINPKTGRISNNYFGINLGFYLGGGAKK
jgi:outer membrane protein W